MTDRGDHDRGHQPPETLVRFVLARLAEVERAARTSGDHHLHEAPADFAPGSADLAAPSVVPIARQAPERALRDVAAKRAVVREWLVAVRNQLVEPGDPVALDAAEMAIAHMAAGYADHPDYRPVWLTGADPTADGPGATPGDRTGRPAGTVIDLRSGRVRRRRRHSV